jgi:hypothetical protein
MKNVKKYIALIFILFGCKKYDTKSLKEEGVTSKETYEELLARDSLSYYAQSHSTNEKLEEYPSDTLYKYLKVLYGCYEGDDRYNLYSINDPILREDAQKVACIVNKNQLSPNSDGTFTLITKGTFGEEQGLCSQEKFIDEPVASFCSGFAVSEKKMATAGHCINESNLSQFAFVYGFIMKTKTVANVKISASDIFYPIKISGRELDNTTQNDYAVVEVDKKIPIDKITRIRINGKIGNNERVHVIGYPSGIPLKLTINANVFNNNINNYFVINSDTYGGNSGSPVFNSSTHIVEGILVRGHTDFKKVKVENCYKSVCCPVNIDTCRGEDVSRVSQFIKFL